MATETLSQPQVLIVGAGPVGLVLAVELARRKVPVRIIDRLAAPTDESRAVVVHARSLEMFARLGVVEQVIARGVHTTAMQVHTGDTILATIPLTDVDSVYPFSVTIAQTETESILTERLAEFGVQIERGCELVDFEQDDDEVRSTVVDRAGQRSTIHSIWIAGTDGAHSTVRHQTGHKLEGSFVGQRFMMGDVDANYHLSHASMHMFFSPDAGPLLLFPMVGNRVRLVAAVEQPGSPPVLDGATTGQPDGQPDAAYDRAEAPTLAELQAVAEARMGPIELLSARWLTYFDVHHAQVARYRQGRAFLLGDAAHVHSPAGGQGMNTGMQDAFNLGWKLAAATRPGRAASHLLDSFHTERHPIASSVISSTTALTTMGTLQNRVQTALRDVVMRVATRMPIVEAKLAAQIEETAVSYRGSSIVAGTSRHHLRPGDAAPQVPEVHLQEALVRAAALRDAVGHVVVTVAPRRMVWPRLPLVSVDPACAAAILVCPEETPPGEPRASEPISGGTAAGHAFDEVLADPGFAVASRYGFGREGGVVVVRPDGYIGLIASLGDQSAVSSYFTLCGRSAVPMAART